jgi:hypothetical protein
MKKAESRGGHKPAGRALGGAPWLVGPSGVSCPPSLAYIFSYIPETPEASMKNNSSRRKFQKHQIPSWDLFRRSAGGGFDHRGPLHQLHGPSDDA